MSQDGSQYELDLDALGLNSTFESTELEACREAPVDCVNTSEMQGPEDFTMNMTYWMTADLPTAQPRSRKEAAIVEPTMRLHAMQKHKELQGAVEEGDRVIIGDVASASPTTRAHSTTDEREHSTPISERSLEHEEKIRSFLSALPDANEEVFSMETAAQSLQHSFLQVPTSSPSKTRSLQATVEDYDTPRKPTQGTVIHHTSAMASQSDLEILEDRTIELRQRVEQQKPVPMTRITELETILAYTRSELEAARIDNYKQKTELVSLEQSLETARSSAEAELEAQDKAFAIRLEETCEEMRLQSVMRLQNQQEAFEHQLKTLRKGESEDGELTEARVQLFRHIQEEATQNQKPSETPHEDASVIQLEKERSIGVITEENQRLVQQLNSIQERAESLQVQLEKANAEATFHREEAQKKETLRISLETKLRTQSTCIQSLESQLQVTKYELECTQTDAAAKQQLFHTNLDLSSRLRALQSELDRKNVPGPVADSHSSEQVDRLTLRVNSLQSQLESVRADAVDKDRQVLEHIQSEERYVARLHSSQGRMEGLEATIRTLRQQVAEAHRDSARLRTDVERLQEDVVDADARLHDAHTEANKKASRAKEEKRETEKRLKDLETEHHDLVEAQQRVMDDMQSKADDAMRKAGALLEQERREKARLANDLERVQKEVPGLPNEAMQREGEEQAPSSPDAGQRDVHLSKLQTALGKQEDEMERLNCAYAVLKNEHEDLKLHSHSCEDRRSALERQANRLRIENSRLKSCLEDQKLDFKAVNQAMDERLASMLGKIVQERAASAVGKRDVQWAEAVRKVQSEKDLLGRVVLKQWGREENGVADEGCGERQAYRYQYVRRSK